MNLITFLVMQGNTQKVNDINLEKAQVQLQRNSNQEDITQVTAEIAEQEDMIELVAADQKSFAASAYKDALNASNTLVEEAKTNLSDAKSAFSDSEKAWNAAQNDSTLSEAQKKEIKAAYERAERVRDAAQEAYDNAVEEKDSAQKLAYAEYTEDLEAISTMQTTTGNVFLAAKKANLEELNKLDTKLELRYNELDTLSKSLSAEKESAKELTESKAEELAPKYG